MPTTWIAWARSTVLVPDRNHCRGVAVAADRRCLGQWHLSVHGLQIACRKGMAQVLAVARHVVQQYVGESRRVGQEQVEHGRRNLRECVVRRCEHRERTGSLQRGDQVCSGQRYDQSAEPVAKAGGVTSTAAAITDATVRRAIFTAVSPYEEVMSSSAGCAVVTGIFQETIRLSRESGRRRVKRPRSRREIGGRRA